MFSVSFFSLIVQFRLQLQSDWVASRAQRGGGCPPPPRIFILRLRGRARWPPSLPSAYYDPYHDSYYDPYYDSYPDSDPIRYIQSKAPKLPDSAVSLTCPSPASPPAANQGVRRPVLSGFPRFLSGQPGGWRCSLGTLGYPSPPWGGGVPYYFLAPRISQIGS